MRMPDAPSQEFTTLVQQVSTCTEGLQTLREAHLDCAAVTLRLHPFVVDATRTYLSAIEGWDGFAREVEKRTTHPTGAGDGERDLLLYGKSGEAEALIEKAEADGRGSHFLCESEPEEVIKAFEVHPYVVFRARGSLERKASGQRK